MDFVNAYKSVKDCIVAIVPKFSHSQNDFPEILGTGFLISSEGIICTCRHVADAIQSLPKPTGYTGYAAQALLFREVETDSFRGLGYIPLEISGIGHATVIGDTTAYLGPNPPDISFMLLPVRETPALEFDDRPIDEGEVLAFAGFPMGTKLLKAPGWLHQLSPSLHWGITSAILPHRLEKIPHAFLMHANTQGGASGSPVFRPNGKVVGMVYMVIEEEFAYGGDFQGGGKGLTIYRVPTSLTGCISRETIQAVFRFAEKEAGEANMRPSLESHLQSASIKPLIPGIGILEEWKQS